MSFGRGLIAGLALLELGARRMGWRGLSWLDGVPEPVVLGALATLATQAKDGKLGALLGWSVAALPVALLAQAGLASLRNRQLNPLQRLAPGAYADRTIERVDVPMPEAHTPALYLVPRGMPVGAVAVLHGSGCDKTYYAWRLADAFVSRGIATLLIDLDGHGESPRIQSFPTMLENASESVAWLRQRHERVGLVGISLGGCLAARAVADGLDVDGLALLEAPPYLHYTRDDMVREARGLLAPFMFGLFAESTAYHLGASVYDLIRVQSGPRIRCTIGTVDLIAALDLLGSVGRISVPLLLQYGGRDAIVRPDQAELVSKAMPPQATFVMVAEASHLTLMLHPGALARMGNWMHQQLTSGPQGSDQ
jgi:pimeloyl-ACP methyl ester carboxylesterase